MTGDERAGHTGGDDSTDGDADEATVHLMTVCSHNRTRSVMTAAMLQSMLDDRYGPGFATVESYGFGPEGLPSIPDAVDAMRRRGLDTSGHVSRQVTREALDRADLVLTAERDHVVRIAAISPTAYRRTFTQPEFLAIGGWYDQHAPTLREWANMLTEGRTARDYLTSQIATEIDDPTGSSPRRFEAAVIELEDQCRRVVDLIGRIHQPPTA